METKTLSGKGIGSLSPNYYVSPAFPNKILTIKNEKEPYEIDKIFENNTETKISIYEDRVKGWFLNFARELTKEKNSEFVVLMICVNYLEGNQQFREGRTSLERESTKMLKKALKKEGVNLKIEEIENNIEIPPSSDLGDYSFPCFFLSKKLKTPPHEIALKIREHLGEFPRTDFEDIQTSGAYVNFFLNRKSMAKNLIIEILKQKEKFGKSNIVKGRKTMIEFSQPNTHKSFHVGHIRGTSLGESLSIIYEFCGEKVLRANYSGDKGMHVAKWIWCYKKYHIKEKLKKDETWIASIYVDAIKRLKKNKRVFCF